MVLSTWSSCGGGSGSLQPLMNWRNLIMTSRRSEIAYRHGATGRVPFTARSAPLRRNTQVAGVWPGGRRTPGDVVGLSEQRSEHSNDAQEDDDPDEDDRDQKEDQEQKQPL